MSSSESLDDSNSAKITLDKEVDGIKMRSSDQELVAVGPGLPCGFETKAISICEDGVAKTYLFLIRAET